MNALEEVRDFIGQPGQEDRAAGAPASAEEPPAESLGERIARCSLPLIEALRYAAKVATVLRDLHAQGLAHGAVSPQSILLEPSGAVLRGVGRAGRLGDQCLDVTAFGALLDEMLCRDDAEDNGPAFVRNEFRELAITCRNESPSMQNVLIHLRLLALQARQHGTYVCTATREVVERRNYETTPRAAEPRIRVRIYLSMRSKPLARLVFALLGK